MFHRNPLQPIDRRDALRQLGAGFGSLGLASVLSQSNMFSGVARAATNTTPSSPPGSAISDSPLAPKAPHFAPKTKHVIQLFMPGGPSQVDTFEHGSWLVYGLGTENQDLPGFVSMSPRAQHAITLPTGATRFSLVPTPEPT